LLPKDRQILGFGDFLIVETLQNDRISGKIEAFIGKSHQ
jgi:hypothetical protein